jgi:hypothetical protein
VWDGEHASGPAVVAGTNRQVSFGGTSSVTTPRGGEVVSDPAPMTITAGTNLAVSTHVAGGTGEVTGHYLVQQDNVPRVSSAAPPTIPRRQGGH